MAKLQTLSRGLRFMLAHPATTLQWAARCFHDKERQEAAEIAAPSEWFDRVARHRVRFEEFLEKHRLDAPTPVRLMNTTPQPQSVRNFELYILGTLCRCLSARNVMEIGTYKGRTAYNLAANVAAGGRVYTLNYVEPGAKDEFVVGEMYRGTSLELTIETILADSLKFDFSRWYGSIDLMFIDGNHSLPYVRKDSDNAFRCVRPGGIIAWHDVDPTHPETTTAALSACERQGVEGWLIDGTQLLLAVQPGVSGGDKAF
jgi:predicted O-methyltransferase YrrM